MTDKLVPQHPEEVMVIREVVPGVTTLSVPFLRFGHIRIGGRGTIVRLQSGALAVFSPVALTPDVKSTLGSAPVNYLIAPDIEHHIFLSAWAAAYPFAKIIGPEGLPEKRAEQSKTDPKVTILPFSTVFTARNKLETKIDPEFDSEFEYEYVDAHPNKELVFFHKASKTLIEADLMFNLPATEQYSKSPESATQGILTKLFGAIMNTKGTAIWQKRGLWYGQSGKDREGFNASARRINAWGFENIVPCHGDSIVGDGKGIFEKVFEWHLQGKGHAAGKK